MPLRVIGGRPLHGAAEPPPDPPIAQIALVVAALAAGESRIVAALDRGQLRTLLRALRALGVEIEVDAGETRIRGAGLHGFRMPAGAIDCERSPHALALCAGLLAAQRFGTRLTLDPRLEAPDLQHLVGSLRARGAHIAGQRKGERVAPPIAVAPLAGEECLAPIECALPVPDPLAKNALLLSGLYGAGATAVSEPLLSSDHLERMLMAQGLPLRRFGSMAAFDPAEFPSALPTLGTAQLPGGVAAAAAAAALACVVAESRVALLNVAFNPTRTGFFDALRLFGARLRVIAKGDRAGQEPIAELQVTASSLRGGALGGEVVLRAADTVPGLCLLGAHANRGLELLDGELCAVADSPLWPALASVVSAFGREARALGAGLAIAPAEGALHAAEVDARGDHRLALTSVLLGLAAEGETVVHGAESIENEWPGLLDFLRTLGANIESERDDER